jgi:PIN domain nuclease of toxin-antitoxin system
MNLLLDTHIWLWSVGDPKRLTSPVAKELANSSNQIWISPVSVWELHLLHRKKRIQLEGIDVEAWVRRTMESFSFNEATMTVDVALEVSKLKLPHGDPADHFLVASARVFGLTLVTADRRLTRAPGISVLANR